MLFTIGDLIIVGLVILVLAVYRQMDSKNRSLEKVKRLGDKLMSDLDALTQEKAIQLKDMSIEVDVHQQTSKAAIERLANAEAGLLDRAAAMEEMQSRIAAYDNALRELINMTQKAEENITRLRDESVYIDKVGRRIRQAAGQLQQLQDRLPQMLSEFETSNHNSLAHTGEQVVAAVESRLAGLEGQLEMSNRASAETIQRMRSEIDEVQQELSAKADAYRRAFDEIEQDYHARLEEVGRKGLALETESLKNLSATITGQIEERYQQLRAHIESNQQMVGNESERLHGRMESMQSEIDGWELAMQQRHEQALDQVRQRSAEQDANLEAAILRLNTIFQEAQGGILGELKSTQDRASERVAELQAGIRQLVDATRQQLGGEIAGARQEFSQWQQEIENLRQESDLELRRKLDDSRQIHEGDLMTLGTQLEKVHQDFAKRIEGERQEFAGWQMDIENVRQETDQELRRTLDEIRQAHENDLQTVGNQLEGVRRELEYQIADAHKENLRTLDEFQQGMQSRVEGLDGSIYQLEQDMAGKLGGVQEKAQTLADHLLMRMNQDVDAKTESMREAINRRVEQVNSSVKASHDQIDASFSELRGRVDEWINASKAYMSQLDEQIRTLNEESRTANQEHQATIRIHITETQERLNAYEQGLTARVLGLETSITRAEGQVQQEFQRVEQRAVELARETGTELDERYQLVRRELYDHLGSQFEQVRGDIEQGRSQLEGLAEQSFARVVDLRRQLDERYREVENAAMDQKSQLGQAFEKQINDLSSALTGHFQTGQGQAQARIDSQMQEMRELVRETHVSLDQTKELHRELGSVQSELDTRLKDQRQNLSAEFAELRQSASLGQAELLKAVQANLGSLQSDLSGQLDEHASLMAKRIQLAGQELTDQARQVQADMDQWRDGLMRQVDELRTLAQGLHQDTLGNIQGSITAVQKQAQELYNRINTEIAGSLNQHEEKILALSSSSEGDLRRLQGLTLETQARINSWQETLGRTEADISRDIQEIREQARAMAQKGNDDLLGQLRKKQDEMSLVIEESMAKLKSDIAHSRGDVEQDVGFLQQQIDQWKGNFQEHLKALQESSKKIEDQALVGLAERIDNLSDEARQLTRKAQDEFSITISQHQAQIQAQLEAYNNDLRRIQVVNKDIQGQMAELEGEVARSKNLIKDSMGEVQVEARRQAEQVKEAVVKEIDERHKALSALIKQAGEQMAGELAGDKTNLDRELALLHQTLDQTKLELTERVKNLSQEGATMRREAMTGFQERVDALRDEARKVTGNVKTEISQILAEHQGMVEKQVKATEAEFHRLQDLNATSTLRFQEIQDIFNKAEAMSRKEFDDLKDKTKQLAELTRQSLSSDIQKVREEAIGLARQGVEALNAEVAQARKAMQAEAAGLANEFDHYSADLGERFSALSKQGMILQEQTIKTFQGDLAKVSAQSDEIARTIQEQASRTLELHRQQIATSLATSADDIGRVRANYLEIQGQVSAVQEDLGKKISAMEADILRFSSDMAERIARTTEERQHQVMVDVEKRIKDYEKEIAYRTAKIETVNDDISNLEHNLRQSMGRLTERLREDLEKIGQQMHQQREQDLVSARQDMESIGLQMVSIEKELDELKQRAYDNVSEKLKVFEDDFFVDLKDRSERMDSRIEEWKQAVQAMLVKLQAQSSAERTKLEEEYAAELSQRLSALAERLGAQTQGVESKVEAFLGKLDGRMVAAEKTVESTDKAIRDEIQTMEANALAGVQKEFTRMNQDLDNRIRAYEREVESRLQKSDVEFRGKTSDLQSFIEAARGDMGVWQTQVLQQIKAADGQIAADLGELKERVDLGVKSVQEKSSASLQAVQERASQAVQGIQGMLEKQRAELGAWQQQFQQVLKSAESSVSAELESLRGASQNATKEIVAEFTRQKTELVGANEQDRLALRKEIQAMEERLANLQGDLEYRGKEALEVFSRDYAGFQADFQRQNLSLHEEQAAAVREFQGFVVDSKKEFEVLQRKLFAKLDEDSKSLDLSMREIDKRIKDFTAQTKLFDRADILASELTQRIDQLKAEIQNVDEQRKTVLDLDPYLVKVRKLADEVNERMARLQVEKKRLDGLDEDYKKLVSISSVVDQKLAQVTASNDTLTSMQLSLRHLEEVQNNVEAKFARLDKKSEILDATSDGIEKNFQYLQDVEQKVGSIKAVMADLPQSVQALGERVSSLLTHKKEADQALKSVTNLDKILKDVEGRIDELNKSRDWIARTETRFQEITREADEKVNLLSTLVKKEVAGGNGRSTAAAGGPAPSVREVVIKLAQQGWKVDEIARTTKLSRGEVELILEMGSRT